MHGATVPSTGDDARVLGSWKEIAAYLGKGVRTVQRWEHEFGLPVTRPKNAHKGFVFSSTDKLDRWLVTNWAQLPSVEPLPNPGSPNSVAASLRDFRRLRQANRELMYDLRQAMEGLRGESQALVHAVSGSSETKSKLQKSHSAHLTKNVDSRRRYW